MNSHNICGGPAIGQATHVTQINPPGINLDKVATDVLIVEGKMEAQKREVTGPE